MYLAVVRSFSAIPAHAVFGVFMGYFFMKYAFIKKGMMKKRKKIIDNQTGYKFVDEALEKKDIEQIRKQIRKEVSDILFDIWLKRSSWRGK